MFKLIYATDKNNLIGSNGKLPWRNEDDLSFFFLETNNKKIICGANTFLNIEYKKNNFKEVIVLDKEMHKSNNHKFIDTNVKFFKSKRKALKYLYASSNKEDIYICGGVKVYESFIKHSQFIVESLIQGEYTGNIYLTKKFLSYKNKKFKQIESKNHNGFSVNVYKRTTN